MDHEGVTNELGNLLQAALALHHLSPSCGQLKQQDKLGSNTLLFSNKMEKDIILKDEFTAMLRNHFINTITHEKSAVY